MLDKHATKSQANHQKNSPLEYPYYNTNLDREKKTNIKTIVDVDTTRAYYILYITSYCLQKRRKNFINKQKQNVAQENSRPKVTGGSLIIRVITAFVRIRCHDVLLILLIGQIWQFMSCTPFHGPSGVGNIGSCNSFNVIQLNFVPIILQLFPCWCLVPQPI